MNQHEILKEYLTALYRAEVVVSDNPSEPLYFNGADSLTDYRIHLLDVELPAIACLREIRRKERRGQRAGRLRAGSPPGTTNYLRGRGRTRHSLLPDDHARGDARRTGISRCHRTGTTRRVSPPATASFLRQKKWFESRKIPLPFPGTLPGNDTDIAEIMALHLHTSLATRPTTSTGSRNSSCISAKYGTCPRRKTTTR